MKTTLRLPEMLGLSLLALVLGCSTPTGERSTASTSPIGTGPVASEVSESSIEVTYGLGHVQRRLELHSLGKDIAARNLYEKQILQEGKIEGPRYDAYFLKVENYCAHRVRRPAAAQSGTEACHNPFKIVLKRGPQLCQAEGCRTHSADDSALSHLIREGEFLLSRAVAPVAKKP